MDEQSMAKQKAQCIDLVKSVACLLSHLSNNIFELICTLPTEKPNSAYWTLKEHPNDPNVKISSWAVCEGIRTDTYDTDYCWAT